MRKELKLRRWVKPTSTGQPKGAATTEPIRVKSREQYGLGSQKKLERGGRKEMKKNEIKARLEVRGEKKM